MIEHPQQGFFGGYLLLNHLARPLEFHCTAPVKPSRAQEILYGPTLYEYLFGEQIGYTLVSRAGRQPCLICTDCPPVLSLREMIDTPVAVILPETEGVNADCSPAASTQSNGTASAVLHRLDGAHLHRHSYVFSVGGYRLAVASADDQQMIGRETGDWLSQFDLAEPFGRIRAAIEEARQAVRTG